MYCTDRTEAAVEQQYNKPATGMYNKMQLPAVAPNTALFPHKSVYT